MLISKSNIEFPDDCPVDCRYINDIQHYGQNSLCFRCPVFNCKVIDDPDGIFQMVEPEDYREDWAKEWKRFFDGKTDYPILTF